jgi:pimeloyl-ACP methyl ester carboxylesterase
MPRLTRPDGAEIFWEERGEGTPLVFSPHAWALPELFERLFAELEGDCRIVRYDARGTGESSRNGPHDMETGTADLVAVVEEAGAPAVVAAMADAGGRAARAGAEHPELISAVVAIGTAPIGIEELQGTDALVASPTVINAFLDMLATDYRGAMRPLMTAVNSQWSEEEVRERMDKQIDYTPQDVMVERIRAWAQDDPGEAGPKLGDRLWLVLSPDTAGPWFPAAETIDAELRRLLPEAHRADIEDGIITRPELTADVIRRVLAQVGAASA